MAAAGRPRLQTEQSRRVPPHTRVRPARLSRPQPRSPAQSRARLGLNLKPRAPAPRGPSGRGPPPRAAAPRRPARWAPVPRPRRERRPSARSGSGGPDGTAAETAPGGGSRRPGGAAAGGRDCDSAAGPPTCPHVSPARLCGPTLGSAPQEAARTASLPASSAGPRGERRALPEAPAGPSPRSPREGSPGAPCAAVGAGGSRKRGAWCPGPRATRRQFTRPRGARGPAGREARAAGGGAPAPLSPRSPAGPRTTQPARCGRSEPPVLPPPGPRVRAVPSSARPRVARAGGGERGARPRRDGPRAWRERGVGRAPVSTPEEGRPMVHKGPNHRRAERRAGRGPGRGAQLSAERPGQPGPERPRVKPGSVRVPAGRSPPGGPQGGELNVTRVPAARPLKPVWSKNLVPSAGKSRGPWPGAWLGGRAAPWGPGGGGSIPVRALPGRSPSSMFLPPSLPLPLSQINTYFL